MQEMTSQLQEQQIDVVILTVPSQTAQQVTDQLVEGGVRGILNFTPLRLSVPSHVRIQNVDLTNELQTLIYFIDHYNVTEEE
jgi:redox-sensing transcriptional repressor